MLITIHNCFFFFFNDTATTEIYTLSLHDALRSRDASGAVLPVHGIGEASLRRLARTEWGFVHQNPRDGLRLGISEIGEHTSELQSRQYLVCRLLLEKKKKITHSS